MNSDNSSNCPEAPECDLSNQTRRLAQAKQVPFVLRAWWLRDFKEYEEIIFCHEQRITAPLWSKYSDPLCDMGSLDYGL